MGRTRTSMQRGRRSAGLSLALAATLTMVACGGKSEDGGAGGGGEGELTTLTVGVIPIIDVAPLYLGIQEGFFEERGLKIETQLAAGGAAIVPAVLSQANEFGFSNNVSLIAAASRQVPIKIVAPGVSISNDTTSGAGGDTGYCEVIVPADSDVMDAAGLAGKNIAVNTLNNIGDVTIRAALEDQGVDPDSVTFSEIPFPDMVTALETGRIDAAWECEPFVTTLVKGGARGVLNNYAATDPNLGVASYFTSAEYAEANPDIVKAFAEALAEAFKFAADNPEETRAIVSEYTQIDPELVLGLPEWTPEFNIPSLERLAELSERYGVTESAVDLDDLIIEQE
jgi:NitT/TauT family transport system substrate-binding protein